jgi:sulfate permease, SulP family
VSRTAVNVEAGARTPLAGLISVVVVVTALQFLTDLLFYIPLSVLAGTIVAAGAFAIDGEVYLEASRASRQVW